MVGCMSFGIKHLLTKGKKTEVPVDGWYHLLPENLGNRKHLIADKNDLVAKQQKHSEQNHHGNYLYILCYFALIEIITDHMIHN